MKSLSLWDRLVFGAISGIFGAVLGVAAAWLVAAGIGSAPALGSVLVFSTAYFFCIGAIRGPDAGFVAGDAVTVVGAIGAAESGIVGGSAQESHRPKAWTSASLLVVWVLVVLLLTWRG